MGTPTARVTTDVVGRGLILGPGAPSVLVNGKPISTVGDKVAPHGKPPHTSPTIITGSNSVFAEGKPVARQYSSKATCGHPVVTGSSNVITD